MRSWGRHWLLFVVIAALLWYALPMVAPGTADLQMIRYYDVDEAGLLEFCGQLYQHGLVPMNGNAFAYPQLFYYFAGVVLFPYTLFRGVDHQVIVLVIRTANIMAAAASAGMLYAIGWRWFRSRWAAIIAPLLLLSAPGYMSLMINSRTHHFELAAILATVILAFRLLEKFSWRKYWLVVGLLGVISAICYGGIFLIIPVWLLGVRQLLLLPGADLAARAEVQGRRLNWLTAVLIGAMLIGLIAPRVIDSLRPDSSVVLLTLGEMLQSRLFRVVQVAMLAVTGLGLGWFLLARRFAGIAAAVSGDGTWWYQRVAVGTMHLLMVTTVVAATFAVLNPTYWLYPKETYRGFVLQFILTAMGTGINPGIDQPVLETRHLSWLGMIFDRNLLGGWGGVLFLLYVLAELAGWRQNWRCDRIRMLQRGWFWLYALILLVFLMVMVTHRAHHYLYPVVAVIALLIGHGAVATARRHAGRPWRMLCAAVFAGLLALYGLDRFEFAREFRAQRLARDTAADDLLRVGCWLAANIPPGTAIATDERTFYIPPGIMQVELLPKYWKLKIETLRTVTAPVLLIAGYDDFELKNQQRIAAAIAAGIMPKYVPVARFPCRGLMAKQYREVVVYCKPGFIAGMR